jgi:hypothetical protein
MTARTRAHRVAVVYAVVSLAVMAAFLVSLALR